MKPSELEEIVDEARQTVKTDSYPMSLGELANMYENEEIILRPEYQRFFRWTHEQKSKLIESILIGLPLPSVFVSQDDKGNWEIVDGMQRLSTIFDFMGILHENNKTHDEYNRFRDISEGLYYLSEFEGRGWKDFSRRLKLDFKRTKLQLTILLRETDLEAKFELFQRLNSGGTAISGQELRNAIMAGTKPEVLEWFEKLAALKDFLEVCGLAQRDLSIRVDVELVLRFIVLLSPLIEDLTSAKSVDTFLTSSLRKILDDDEFDYSFYENKFKKTFQVINQSWGEGALKFKTTPGSGKFSISFFEAVALGIAHNIGNLPSKRELEDRINKVGKEKEFRSASGSGKNAQRRIPALVKLGKEYFAK